MSVRFYGQNRGEVSMARVTRGMIRGLTENGIAVEGLVELDAIVNELEPPPAGGDGAFAKHGLLTSMPNQVECFAKGRHELRWTLVSPNSTQIGSALQSLLYEGTDRIFTPSEWAKGVLDDLFDGKVPVHVAPHGVGDIAPDRRALEIAEDVYSQGGFHIVHFSSSGFQRKGTIELAQAFGQAREKKLIPPRSTLNLVLDRAARTRFMEEALEEDIDLDGISLNTRWNMKDDRLGAMLGRFNLVAQPSRGEAFGMVPLEARCVGVPALMTGCTGHSQHLHPAGTAYVATGKLAPIEDLPGSMAPSLSVDAVVRGLENAYSQWGTYRQELRELGPALAQEWSWETQLQNFANQFKG